MFTTRLSADAKTALGLLGPLLPPDTYLAGGSALALQLDHRQSYDLDLYSQKEFNVQQLLEQWKKLIPQIVFNSAGWQTVSGKFGDTDISLFYYDYPLIGQCELFESVPIASIADIAAMKVEAISGRGKKRDFFDLFSICQNKTWSLIEVVEFGVKKYGLRKDTLAHNLKSLTYFNDADADSERIQLSEKEWQAVKAFFLEQTPRTVDYFLKIKSY